MGGLLDTPDYWAVQGYASCCRAVLRRDRVVEMMRLGTRRWRFAASERELLGYRNGWLCTIRHHVTLFLSMKHHVPVPLLQRLGFALKDKNWGAFLPGSRSPWSVARSIPEAGSRDHHDHSRKAGRRGGKSPRTRTSKPRSIPTFPFGRPSAPTARWTVPSSRIDEQSQPLHEFDGMSAHPTTSRFTLDRAREALARVKKITAEKNRIHHHWFVAEMLTQASQRCRPR